MTDAVPGVAISLAAICAVSCVAETTVVGFAAPFHCSVDCDMNPDPVAVKVKAGPEAKAKEGFKDVKVGVGIAWIAKLRAGDTPPPAATFETVIDAFPTLAMSLAAICAVSWVAETTVVGFAAPFHCSVDCDTNPVPVAVKVNDGPPAAAEEGFTAVKVGVGTDWIAKVTAADTPPPPAAFDTVIETLPALTMALAAICAVSCVAETNVVGIAVPFHCSVDCDVNPVPVAVKVNAAPPAGAEEGLTDIKVGVAPPLGAGLPPPPPPPPHEARTAQAINMTGHRVQAAKELFRGQMTDTFALRCRRWKP